MLVQYTHIMVLLRFELRMHRRILMLQLFIRNIKDDFKRTGKLVVLQ